MAIDLEQAQRLSQRVQAEAVARARLETPLYLEPIGIAATLFGLVVGSAGIYWLDSHWVLRPVVCAMAAFAPGLAFQVYCLRRRVAAMRDLLDARATE